MTTTPNDLRPFVRLPRSIAPFGYRNYLLYWIGFTVSNTGRWIEITGTVWLLYSLTSSPFLLGLLGIARAVPSIILSAIGGVVVDRVHDQRRLLFITQALAALNSGVLWILVLTGNVQFWHIYVEVALQGVIAAFDTSCRQALFPRLVPRDRLPEAVTLTFSASRSSALIGPAIGGLAIAGPGVAFPFLLNALSFLALMVAVILMWGIPARSVAVKSSVRGELMEGLRHIVRAPVLSGLLRLEIVFSFFQMNPVTIAIIGREVLHVGPEGLGWLLSAPALGSLVGITTLLVVGQSRRQGRFVIISQLLYAVGLLFIAVSPSFVLILFALALTGCMDSLAAVTRSSVMQLAAPGQMRGRVMANMGTVTRGLGPLAQTQAGMLADAIGGPMAVVASAAALVVSAASTARMNRALWRFSLDDAIATPGAPGPSDAPSHVERPAEGAK